MAERTTPRRCGTCPAETPTVAAALSAGWTGGKGHPWTCAACGDRQRREEANRRLARRRPIIDREAYEGPPQKEPLDATSALTLLCSMALMGRMFRRR